MGLTEQQAAAAHADRSIAVTAGAGTGKTHMLAERYLFHLESKYSPLNIVALTFTEKAATEMRSRIRQTIRARLPNSEFLAELEAAQISTFHALAARICREHPEAADVPPDFAVLDDVDGQVWLTEALAEALDQIPLPLYEQVPYTLLRTIVGSLLSDPLTAEKALQKERQDWLPELQRVQQQALQDLITHPVWLAAQDTLQTYTAPGDKLDLVRQEALQAMTDLEQNCRVPESLKTLCDLNVKVGSQKAWGGKENLDTVKDAIKGLRGLSRDRQGMITLAPNAWDEQIEALLPALRSAFGWVRHYLSVAKKRQRVLDFNDLEIHALQALQNPEVREYYAQRWRVFLIDEFQDTNPVQGELLEQLTANQLVTIVGDVKQSIYGFRRADVQVFQSWCARFHTPQDPPKELSLSFRTHHRLVQDINHIFAPVLDQLHQDLEAHRQIAPDPEPHLQVFTIQTDEKLPIERLRQLEAQQIAQLLQTMMQEQVMVHDKATGNLRPIDYRDIAILSRTWGPLELYGQALSSQNIPILLTGGGNLLKTREAKDAQTLLRFLADPTDDIALVALLRSPFFAISDRVLFHLAQTLPEKTSWWKHLKQNASADLQVVLQVLNRLLIERRTEPPTRLLQMADRATGYTAVIANLPNAPRRMADWQGFLDFVHQLEQGTGDTLTVVRRLTQLSTSEVNVPRPALEAGNAVSLMTIHASKGLEWPVVIVADLTRQAAGDHPTVRFDPELGLALKLQDEDGKNQTSALYTLLQHRKQQAEAAEAKRVLYVALTRARDRLILTAAKGQGGGLDVLQLDPARITEIPVQDNQVGLFEIVDPPQPTIPSQILLRSPGSGLWELPVTSLNEYALCPKRFHYRYIEGHPGFPTGTGTAGKDIGIATHWALQHQVQDLPPLLLQFPHLSQPVLQEALELAQRFYQLEVYQPYRSTAGKAEHPITLNLGPITFHGVIDWFAPGFVLDFKTDQEQTPHHYRMQLWAYAQATGSSTAHIAYLRHDTIHTFTDADLETVTQEAHPLIEKILVGNYKPSPSLTSCKFCPYLEICEAGSLLG